MVKCSLLNTGFQLGDIQLPDNASQELLSKFTEKNVLKSGKVVHTLSTKMKDKIRLHLFVLALMVDDFTVDSLSLQKDLKLSCLK